MSAPAAGGGGGSRPQRSSAAVVASAIVSSTVASGYWLATLAWDNAPRPVGERALLWLWMSGVFAAVGVGLGLCWALVGGRWPRLAGPAARWSWPGGAWTAYFLFVRLALHGVYYEDWGIESRWAAAAIRMGQAAAGLATAGLVFGVGWVLLATVRRRRWIGGACAAGTVAVLWCGLAASGDLPSPAEGLAGSLPPTPPVAILGFDGLDWDVLAELAAELPTFARLERRCATARLESLPLGSSPLIWNTVSTGVGHRQHGIGGHTAVRFRGMERPIYVPHRTGFNHGFAPWLERLRLLERRPASSGDRRRAAFWDLARVYRLPTALAGWYGTWPAEPVHGVNVVDRAVRQLSGGSELSPSALREWIHPPSMGLGLASLLRREGDGDLLVALRRTLEWALARVPEASVIASYSAWPDSKQHRWWHTHQPERFFFVDRQEVARRGDVIADVYRRIDRHLEGVLGMLPAASRVLVLSDHGAGPVLGQWRTRGDHANAPPGYLAICGPGVAEGRRIEAGVFDILPTVAWLKGIPPSEEWSGRVLVEAFADVSPPPVTHRVARYGRQLLVDGGAEPTAIDDEVLDRLRALGYVN